MTYVVETTDSAEHEFEQQYGYITKRTRQGANSWALAFRDVLKKLEGNPASYPLAPESERFSENVHQVIFKTRRGNAYRALFIIRKHRVYVIHIRGFGQDIIDPNDLQLPEAD